MLQRDSLAVRHAVHYFHKQDMFRDFSMSRSAPYTYDNDDYDDHDGHDDHDDQTPFPQQLLLAFIVSSPITVMFGLMFCLTLSTKAICSLVVARENRLR